MMSVMVAVGVHRYRATGIRTLSEGGLLMQFYKDGTVYFLMLLSELNAQTMELSLNRSTVLNCLNIAIHIFGVRSIQSRHESVTDS